MCIECALTLDVPRIEHRVDPDGREFVRVAGNVTWGRLPECDGPRLVCVDVASDWEAVGSDEGNRLLAAKRERG